MNTALSDYRRQERTELRHSELYTTDPYPTFVAAAFDWACDVCLADGTALRAIPARQNFCWHPRYAYFDSKKACRSCGTAFVFDKTEKRFWYEVLRFWTDAEAVRCPACRRAVRQRKRDNGLLSELLRRPEATLTAAELQQIVTIYQQWELDQRADYYRSVLRKRHNQ